MKTLACGSALAFILFVIGSIVYMTAPYSHVGFLMIPIGGYIVGAAGIVLVLTLAICLIGAMMIDAFG